MSRNQLPYISASPEGALWVKPSSPMHPDGIEPDAKPLTPAEVRVRNPGRRYSQIVKLKPACYADYKKCHAAVWPEVAKQIKNCGIVDCRLLLLLYTLPITFSLPRSGLPRSGVLISRARVSRRPRCRQPAWSFLGG